jgi:hypothetical protein
LGLDWGSRMARPIRRYLRASSFRPRDEQDYRCDERPWKSPLIKSSEEARGRSRPQSEAERVQFEDTRPLQLTQTGSRRVRTLIFSSQDAHHEIILPLSVDKRCISLPTLDNEATFFIGTDGAMIIGNNTH